MARLFAGGVYYVRLTGAASDPPDTHVVVAVWFPDIYYGDPGWLLPGSGEPWPDDACHPLGAVLELFEEDYEEYGGYNGVVEHPQYAGWPH